LQEGELVISEGLQRVRAGEVVSPGPASPPPTISPAGQGSSSGPAPPPADGATEPSSGTKGQKP